MRKHTFGKCLSSALAFALAFTTVIPGNAVITAKAEEEVKQLTFGFTVDGENYTPDPADPWEPIDIVGYKKAEGDTYSEYYDEENPLKPYVAGKDMPEGTYLLANDSFVPVSGQKYVAANKENYKTIALTEFVGVAELSEPAVEGEITKWAEGIAYYTVDGNGVYSPVDQSDLEEPVAGTTYYTIVAEALDVAGFVEPYVGDSVYGLYTKSGEGEDAVYTPCGVYDVCQSGVTYYQLVQGTDEVKNADIHRTLPAVPEKENNTGAWTFTDPDGEGTDVTYDSETRELFIDGEWLSKNKAESGWDLAFNAAYTQVACDVTFKLTGVESLTYSIDGGAAQSLDMTTKKIKSVKTDSKLRILSVEAADFYAYTPDATSGYITAYLGLTVAKGNETISLTAETANSSAYYDLGKISGDTTVSVTVANEVVTADKTVTVNDETKSLAEITYVQLKQNSKGEWVAKGSAVTKELTAGVGSFDVETGNKIKITGWEYASGAYNVISAVKEKHITGENPTASAITAAADGSYTTGVIGEAVEISFDTKTLESSGFTFKNSPADAELTASYGDSLAKINVAAEGEDPEIKDYIKAAGGFAITYTPAAGSAVSKVEYKIGNVTKTADKTSANVWTIPEADVQAAIIAGGAEITATVTDATYTVKVTKPEHATATYRQYSVTTDDKGKATYTLVGEDKDIEITFADQATSADISVGTGNVIAIAVKGEDAEDTGESKHNAYYVTASSVKNNGVVIAPGTDDTKAEGYEANFVDKYVVSAATTGTGITIAAKPAVGITKNEAEKTKTEGSSTSVLKTWTATAIKNGAESDVADNSKLVVKNTDIVFTTKLTEAAGRGTGYEEYYATLGTPVVKCGDTTITTKYDKNEKTYTISKADVLAAIEAGKPITITAAATEKAVNTFKISVAKGVTGVTFDEYKSASDSTPFMSHTSTAATGDDDTDIWTSRTTTTDAYITGEVLAGNYVVITGVAAGTDSDATFIKVTSGSSEVAEMYTVNQNTNVKTYLKKFALGTISNNSSTFTVSVATLDKSNVLFAGDAAPVEPKEDRPATISGALAPASLKGTLVKNWGDVPVTLRVSDNDNINEYKIDSPVTYKITNGNTTISTGQLDTAMTDGKVSYSLSRDAIRTAAVNGAKLTITANLKVVGQQKQIITIQKTTGATTTITANDTSLLSGSYAEIPYNQNAKVTVTGDKGYTLEKVCYITVAKETAKKAEIQGEAASWTDAMTATYEKWLKETTGVTVKNNKAEFTIPKVTEKYNLYNFTSESYSLVVGDKEVADGTTFTRDYNAAPLTIEVLKGDSALNLGSNGSVVTAVVSDASKTNVTSAVFGSIGTTAAFLSFDSSAAEAAYGKTVTVTITEAVTGDAKPKYDYAIKFVISEPITTDLVNFKSTEDVALPLGTTTTIPLATAAKGFNKDIYEPVVTVNNVVEDNSGLTIKKSADGKSLSVTAEPAAYTNLVTSGKEFVVKLADKHGAIITSTGVKVTVNTTQVVNADLSKITAVADTDSITFNFSGVNATSAGKFDTSTAELYYKITATKTNVLDENNGFATPLEVLVPASAKSYNLRLVDDESKIIVANPVKYTVEVALVQVTEYDGVTYDAAKKVAESKTPFTSDKVETIVDSIFATKITFKKDASAPKAIYSTMDEEFVLGTVSFPDVAKNTPVTAQRISKVELLNAAGKAVGGHVDYNGKDITFNVGYDPADADNNSDYGLAAGKYSIVVYALEPLGKEVTCKIPVTVAQGITYLDVSAPETLYKAPGKAAKITAKVAYYPNQKPLPANRKVTWVLYDDTLLETWSMAGVTIKNGSVTIAKNVVIPSDGIAFRIGAIAADYAGHDLIDLSDPITVYSTPMNANGFTIMVEDTELIDGKSYYSDEIAGQLKLLDADNVEIKGVKFTVSGITGMKDAFGNITSAYAFKVANKAAVTATLTDGSKVKKAVKFSVKSDINLETNGNFYDYTNYDETSRTYVNSNDANTALQLKIHGENGSLINHTVSFDGFKPSKAAHYVYGTVYSFVPTKRAATITVTDKTNNAKQIIRVTNNKFTDSTVKTATKVTASNIYEKGYNAKTKKVNTVDAKGRIFNHLDYDGETAYKNAGSFNKVTYTVTDGKTPMQNKTVLITTSNAAFAEAIGGYTKEVDLDKDGKFVIDYQDGTGHFDLAKGTYSFNVTPINDDGEAIARTATVKVVAAPAPKANVVMSTTNFAKFSSEASIGFKTMNYIVFDDTLDDEGNTIVNGATSAKFTGNRLGVNTKGKINKFSTVFNVDKDDNKLTCVQAPKGYDEAYTAKPAAGMQGWIEYEWTNLDGSKGTTYVKVKVTPIKGMDIIPK